MKSIYIVLFASLLLTSCKKDDNPVIPTSSSNFIIPLAVGNTWLVRISKLDTLGNTTSTYIDTYQILRDTTITNEQWFIMKYYYNSIIICKNKSDGFYVQNNGSATLLLKYPAAANDTYQSPNGSTKVISTNANVSVPKGSFTCYQYQNSFLPLGGFSTNDYYASSVGFVRFEVASGGSSKAYISAHGELVDYDLR